jgi:hypothetical protein
MRPLFTLVIAASLLAPSTGWAQEAANILLVSVRVLSPTDPADRFEITSASPLIGAPLRATSAQRDDAGAQGGSAEVRVLSADGIILHAQPFTWSRVRTVPPAEPGSVETGPNVVVLEQPEVTLLLPVIEGAARIEVMAAGTAIAASSRALAAPPVASTATSLELASPAPATPGTFNLLLLASGFTPARIGLFPSIAASIQTQMLRSEPFSSNASRLAVRSAQALTNLGCSPGCGGVDRLMCCTSSAVMAAAVSSGLPFDEIIVVHDTPTYAGSGSRDYGGYRANSASSYAVAYNGPWTEEMAVHEFGHSFGDLCDEYTYSTESFRYSTCANCRPSCSDLGPFGSVCTPSCDAQPSYFRPEPSIMLDLTIPTFNNASISTVAPVHGLATRLQYFTGSGAAGVPATPTGLQSQVVGNSVTLFWTPAPASSPAVSSYVLQVGTAAGQSNLFNQPIGNTTSVSGAVGVGQYFWRLIATNAAGASAASAEAQFGVGGGAGCSVPPSAPQALTSAVAGGTVTLSWSPPAGPVTTYIVEAGSAPGLANLYNAPLGSAATVLQTPAPRGTYHVRVRAQNACGTSAPSNEQIVTVP